MLELQEIVRQLAERDSVVIQVNVYKVDNVVYINDVETLKTRLLLKSTSSENKQSYITVKTADGGEQALLVTAEMPEVRGVAVVCRGGDDELINEKIKNAVTAALNITSKRVYIAGGTDNEKR